MIGRSSRQVDGQPVVNEGVRRGGRYVRRVLSGDDVVVIVHALARGFGVVSVNDAVDVVVVIVISLFPQHQSRRDASQRLSVLHPVDVTDGRIGVGAAFDFRRIVSRQIQELGHMEQLWRESDVEESFGRRGGESVGGGTVVPARIPAECRRNHESTLKRNTNLERQ